jgi:hypothetical protein
MLLIADKLIQAAGIDKQLENSDESIGEQINVVADASTNPVIKAARNKALSVV